MALSAVLTVIDAGRSLQLRLHNDGDGAVRVPMALLAAPLVLELTDAAGAPVALGPPPVPPADLEASLRTIAPGDTLALTFEGPQLLPAPPRPGRYRVRARAVLPALGPGVFAGELTSDWVSLDVGA